MTEPPPLLHSLSEFSSLIFPCLQAAGARHIVEVGSETGDFTRELCDWAAERGGSVTSIEPSPREEHRLLERDHGLRLIEGKSPQALAQAGAFDAYVLDGDHNHYCVSAELRHAFGDGGTALAILHDVAWPSGRRDTYYEPGDIPPEHRHPFSYDGGVEPGNPGLVRGGGFRGENAFAYANEEGGPANGVLTAVEDVLAEREDLELLVVPAIFGLGVVFPRGAPWAGDVRAIVGPFHEHPLLERMEANRIDLFLRLIDPHRFHAGLDQAGGELLAAQQREIEALQGELSRLRLELAQAPATT